LNSVPGTSCRVMNTNRVLSRVVSAVLDIMLRGIAHLATCREVQQQQQQGTARSARHKQQSRRGRQLQLCL
jgi:hypothetical protein